MHDLREHRSARDRDRGRVDAVADRQPRCHPTLFARFDKERLVEVEHRHIERRPTVGRGGGGPTVDEGCHGPCVGRCDVLPLSYLRT